jgi:hypothetical protein
MNYLAASGRGINKRFLSLLPQGLGIRPERTLDLVRPACQPTLGISTTRYFPFNIVPEIIVSMIK